MDAVEIAGQIRKGTMTAEDAVAEAVKRARKVNGQINAIIADRYEAAIEDARSGNYIASSPLAGVPTLTKDLLTPAQGEAEYDGNRILKKMGHVANHDCHVVTKMKQAGLISIGRTNVPEFGSGMCAASTENEAFGATKNPWDLKRTAMGSSGGAAAAVAARIVPIAHGNDGGGSIRLPASACGVVGLKPSRGRISFGPDFGEFWGGAVTHGMLSLTVRDAALGLDVLSGYMPGDPYTAPMPERPFVDEIGRDPGKLRIGLCTVNQYGRIDPACIAAVEKVGNILSDMGHKVKATFPAHMFDMEMATAFIGTISANLAFMLESAHEWIGRPWTESDMEKGTWDWYCQGREISAAQHLGAVFLLNRYTRKMADWWEGENGFDLLVSPVLSAPAPRLGYLIEDVEERTQRLLEIMPYTAQFNVTGQPAISLPLHWTDDGLPIGVQFVARYANEALLIRVSAQIEEAMPWADRLPPIVANS